MSLRQVEEVSNKEVSNAYLSQLERGLHAPSVRVLKSLADAFNISAETMLERAGLLDETGVEGERSLDTEAAIKADTRLSQAQKEALLAVYRGFVGSPS